MASSMRSVMNLQARPMCAAVRPARATLVVRAGLLDFFRPSPSPASNPRAAEVVEELISIASSTLAGTKATAERREQIEELVGELKQFGVKNPARSKLLYGQFEVLYASAPAAPGGPLAGPTGPIALSGKLPTEALGEDGSYSSTVQFKALGFLSGSFKKIGSIKAVSGDSYVIEFKEARYSSGFGSPAVKESEDSVKVQLLYLSDELRVVEVTPEDSEDSVLMVLRRVDADEEEEEEEEEPVPAPKGSRLFRAGSQSVGMATMAERQVMRQMAAEQEKKGTKGTAIRAAPAAKPSGTKGTGVRAVAPPAPKPDPRAVAQALKIKESEEKEKVAARSKEEREAAKAKDEKERQAKAARDKAEAEKRAAADRQASIKDLLADLSDALKERQAEAKEAFKRVTDLERSNGPVLRKVSAARAELEEAKEEAEEAEEALGKAGSARKDAEQQLKEAQAALAQAKAKAAGKAK